MMSSAEAMGSGDDTDFGAILGKFGTNSSPPAARKERERKASTAAAAAKRTRRSAATPTGRVVQFNVRVTADVQRLALELCREMDGSQADMIEAAILALAREKGLSRD